MRIKNIILFRNSVLEIELSELNMHLTGISSALTNNNVGDFYKTSQQIKAYLYM